LAAPLLLPACATGRFKAPKRQGRFNQNSTFSITIRKTGIALVLGDAPLEMKSLATELPLLCSRHYEHHAESRKRGGGNLRDSEVVDALALLDCRSCKDPPTCWLTHSSFPTNTLQEQPVRQTQSVWPQDSYNPITVGEQE